MDREILLSMVRSDMADLMSAMDRLAPVVLGDGVDYDSSEYAAAQPKFRAMNARWDMLARVARELEFKIEFNAD